MLMVMVQVNHFMKQKSRHNDNHHMTTPVKSSQPLPGLNILFVISSIPMCNTDPEIILVTRGLNDIQCITKLFLMFVSIGSGFSDLCSPTPWRSIYNMMISIYSKLMSPQCLVITGIYRVCSPYRITLSMRQSLCHPLSTKLLKTRPDTYQDLTLSISVFKSLWYLVFYSVAAGYLYV